MQWSEGEVHFSGIICIILLIFFFFVSAIIVLYCTYKSSSSKAFDKLDLIEAGRLDLNLKGQKSKKKKRKLNEFMN